MKHTILVALLGLLCGGVLGCGEDDRDDDGGASSSGGQDGGTADDGSGDDGSGGDDGTADDGSGGDDGDGSGTDTGGETEDTGGTDTGGGSGTDTGSGSATGGDADIEGFCEIVCDVCFNGNAPWQSQPVDQCIPECIADFEDCPPDQIPAILECTGGPNCPEGAMGFATCVAPYTCLLS